MYARGVRRANTTGKSPIPALLFGLVITVAAVGVYAAYVTRQISGLRHLQTEMVDRARLDSLQLLRIQNDLNTLGVAMRDMLDNTEPYPLTAWSAQFQRVRDDLDDALRNEEKLAVANRTPEQRRYLQQSVAQFWEASDGMFAFARNGKAKEAHDQLEQSLQARQSALSALVARLLVENNDGEREAESRISQIYDRVQRQVYVLMGATLLTIALTSLYLMRSNRRLFARIEALSEQRSELAQKLIATQESIVRSLSRELHDEFGQILTAIGSMLTRAGKQLPPDSALRSDLREISQTAQDTLDKVRSLSQALHPVILDEAGLEAALDWYVPNMARQTGMAIKYEKSGTPYAVPGRAGIHVYRVVQEALNNVARHAGTSAAQVRLRFLQHSLEVDIEDHGTGMRPSNGRGGIGLVAMRERAELLRGQIEIVSPPGGGTVVKLSVPREQMDEEG